MIDKGNPLLQSPLTLFNASSNNPCTYQKFWCLISFRKAKSKGNSTEYPLLWPEHCNKIPSAALSKPVSLQAFSYPALFLTQNFWIARSLLNKRSILHPSVLEDSSLLWLSSRFILPAPFNYNPVGLWIQISYRPLFYSRNAYEIIPQDPYKAPEFHQN